METIIGGAEAGGAPADLIKDSDMQTFMADVVDASREQPVLVDFWAPWCGPCKQLTPILEKVVTQAGGKVKLVKVNIDENQQIAQQMRIQSIPAVFAFKDGQPVDGFMGALPESQVREFIDRVAGGIGPSPADEIIEAARQAVEAGDHARAAQAWAALLEEDPESPEGFGGLARAYIELGELEAAEQVLDQAPASIANHAEVSGARAALDLAKNAADPGASEDVTRLEGELETDPSSSDVRFQLAEALLAVNRKEDAAAHLLHIVEHDREWNEDGARKKLLQLFEAWGPKDPLVKPTRRKLSAMLLS
ncbi:MAG: thioredoxin [Minwuia sp.]|uniref:thioredoxin n=1 Tax=Minwuia sp. TaxID=2493630 RepID=UPI003A87A84C